MEPSSLLTPHLPKAQNLGVGGVALHFFNLGPQSSTITPSPTPLHSVGTARHPRTQCHSQDRAINNAFQPGSSQWGPTFPIQQFSQRRSLHKRRPGNRVPERRGKARGGEARLTRRAAVRGSRAGGTYPHHPVRTLEGRPDSGVWPVGGTVPFIRRCQGQFFVHRGTEKCCACS